MTVTSLTDEQVAEMKAAAGKELLPCPLCGGEAAQSRTPDPWLDRHHRYFVRCTECKAQSAGFDANVDDSHGACQKARTAWNRRSDPPELTDLRERLGSLTAETIQWRGGHGGVWPDALGAAADALAEFEGGIDVHSDVDARAALVVRTYIDAQPVTNPETSSALKDVAAERQRQVEAEGWTPAHDDGHKEFELSRAAATYALWGTGVPLNGQRHVGSFRTKPYSIWPWGGEWWKPRDRRRNLVKAGALILAEIERLDRLAAKGGDK